ncbi:MAG TPA: DUF423 domain-containing protein [Steroidobacteraceae bacterium]|jgi:uncharacterized membrane protein YgdD (TMEM256/DUF423 family)|nr:DUF423 domain-containing protein [Steroidobacteraceae bacterium]
MRSEGRRFCQLAAVSLALATILSAIGAHALKHQLIPDRYEILQTALHFQFVQSLGLLGVGLLYDRVPVKALHVAAWLLIAGIALFSGSLYLMLVGAPRWVGVLTPLGGLSLILAWCLTAIALRRRSTGALS